MLTRIPKSDVRKGMFVESVECSEAVFGKRRFVLESDGDFGALLNSPAEFVVINTAYGRDSGPAARKPAQTGGKPPLSPAEARAEAKETVKRSVKVLKSELVTLVTGEDFDMAALAPMVEEFASADNATSSLFFEVTRLKNKDETTFQHSLAVASLMGKLGDALDLDRETVETLVLAGLVHDVGKLTISNAILQKPSGLTPEERKLIQSHPRRGHHILKKHPAIPEIALDICLHHHEALDGSGYPDRLKGDDISLMVRIATVCDVFDALTSVRPYKKGWVPAEALSWMFARDHQFDRKLVLRLGASIDA